ncbi:tetratricopeptide repeat-containing sensor histidine kinase [Psychroserpens ponticola]|uniref:Tetratricopeptide repeat protein n=1 Tax=Psychroserpens ponticola TaxID=2932268 RepID=A0ABY7RVD4_9FLAO|nr:tetratricopeptide repeat protein [Psychroserpens ponticola]WCO01072.1 tetratricopeptide repeat protein [Psychroserpens ponticola]
MKNVLLIIIILFVFQFTFSQQEKKIDSLETILLAIKNDSLLLDKYKEITKTYRSANSDIHLHFIKKYLKASDASNSIINKAGALRELSEYYSDIKKLDSALMKADEAIELYKSIDYDYGVVIVKNSKAIILQEKGDYTNALKTFKEVVSYLEKDESKYTNALWLKMNIGALYAEINEFDKAIDYYMEVYNDPKAQGNNSIIGRTCINLANSYRQKKEFKKALSFALEAEQKVKRPRSLASLKSCLASVYSKLENYEKAHDYNKQALVLYKSLNLQSRVDDANHNIAYNYLHQKKYDDAEYYFLKTNMAMKSYDNIYTKKNNFQGLSELYYAKKEYKKAFDFYEKHQNIKDSIHGIDKLKAISDIEIKYETEKTKREKETAEQQVIITKLESQKNRNLFIGSLSVAGLLLLASVFYFSRLKAQKKAELVTIELKETQKRLAVEKQYKDSELKALKAQMNPHFIFNALNSIQDYIVLNQKNLASDYLGKFADLIRNYLHFSDTGFISIPDEVHNLNLYLELEKLRFEESLEYSIHLDDNANFEEFNIPTMLIQPYIENALKHGLLHKKDNRKLSISISKFSDKIVECVIEDNGIGREKSKEINQKRASHHKSFALKATTERLDLLNYGRDKKIGVEFIDLKVNNEAVGTKVILKIPILKN